MRLTSQKYCFSLLVLIALIDVTYSSTNDTSTEGQRNARVSGRIVKLYSGPKPSPVVCLGEGFQKDAVDCSVFYRCLKTSNGKYTVYRFQCGPGTVYDPETEICNHPRSTKRFECGGLISNKLNNPTEKYIENEIEEKENHELPSPISTKPPPLPTTDTAHTTDASHMQDKMDSSYLTTFHSWSTTSNNVFEAIYASTTSHNVVSDMSTKSPTNYTPSEESSTGSRKSSLLNGNKCTSDGFMGDIEDCRKFYRCVNNQRGGYIRYEFSCSETTVWDDDTQGCNHPWAVQRRRCGKGYANEIKNNKVTPNKFIEQQTQIPYNTEVLQTQLQTSNVPVTQNETQSRFGDRLNLVKPNIKQNRTQINYGSTESDTRNIYGSLVTQIQLDIHLDQSSKIQTPVTELGSSYTTMSAPTQNKKNYNNNKCQKDGFMGDSDDCKKFYRCVSNGEGGFIKYEFSCSDGTLWDDKLEACNHAWAVKECGGKTSNQNVSPVIATVTSPKENIYTTSASFLNNEIDDDNGYVSHNNQQELEPIKSSTAIPITVTTESSNIYKTDCSSSGFYGNKNDCTIFYRCVENGRGGFTKYEYKCGEGTVWDSEIESCNHARAVQQCSTGFQNETIRIPESTSSSTILTTVSLIQTTTQKNIEENDYDSGYGLEHKETPPHLTTSTERMSYQGNNCVSAGFMRDDNDCKKFYRCVENGHGNYTRYEFTCGEGTVWDPKLVACNHAWAVEKCGDNAIKDNNINEMTTIHSVPQYDTGSENGYVTHIDNGKNPEYFPQSTTLKSTTKNNRPVSDKENECKDEGFMGSNNDCKIFYRCVENGNGGFIRYEFSCGDGTVWDPKITACNYIWAVKKCGGNMTPNENISPSTQGPTSGTSSTYTENSTKRTTEGVSISTILPSTSPDVNNGCMINGFMGDKHDCKKFYRCVEDGKNGFTRYEFSCGEGTVWDPKIEACNHLWAVQSCGGHVSSVETSSTTTSITLKDETDNNYVTQVNQEISSSTVLYPLSSSTVKSSTVTNNSKECTTEGFMGDTNDCKVFYRCVNDGRGSYIRYEFSCGEGTVWDSEINACNHINSVKTSCNVVVSQTTKESDQVYTSTTSSPLGSSPYENNNSFSTTSKPVKSQQCENEGFVGDKDDCKKFYRCVNNGQGGFHKYQFVCGEGTIWDQEILACNHAPSDQRCSSTDTESHTNNSSTSVSYSSSTSISVTQSTEKIDTPASRDKCTSDGFHANPNDCKKFFRCVSDGKNGFTKYDFTCGEGTIWVQEIQACDHDIDNSNCSKSTMTTTIPNSSNQEQPVRTTSIPNPTSTDFSASADEYDGQSPHKPVATNEDVCESEGFYPNKNDCKQFYQCVNNGDGGYRKYEFACSEGTAWDVNTQSCNHISEVKGCQHQNQNEIHTKPTLEDESASELSSSTEGTSKGSTTISSTNPDSCEESGFFGNSKDCKKFYRCVDNGKGGLTKYDFTCGDGTIWDQDITACNHPQDVVNPSCKNSDSTSSTTSMMTNESSETKSTPATDSSTQSTTSEDSNQSSEDITKKPNNGNYSCSSAGFYADPYDCTKFYRCVDWGGDGKTFSIYHFECGEGTIWDPELQTCNHENSVYPQRNCNGTQSQVENGNDNNMSTEGTTAKQDETTETSSTTTATQSSTQQSTTSTSTTTTESSSTVDQTSTQQSTTEQSTTNQSTTEQSSTQSSTTEQSTTHQSTTEQSSTQPSTTEQITTQESTTSQNMTQQSTTEQSTTEMSTEQTTSQQTSTTAEQTTTTTTEQTTTTTTEQPTTTTTEEKSTTISQSTTSESTTSTAEMTTKADQTTTQESNTEQTSENQSSTTEQSSTSQESTDSTSTTESGQDTTTEKQSTNKECPQTDDDQYLYVCPTGFRRHPKYCNLFYQCTEDDDSHDVKVAVFNCPNNTIYDESKTQCVEEEKAEKKCEGQIAQKRRVKRLDADYKEPITVNREKYSCPTVGHFPFEKNEECSPVLYKCEVTKTGKLRGLVYRCPEGYVYWSISRRCEAITAMTGCSRRSFLNWSKRHEIPTERKNVAKK